MKFSSLLILFTLIFSYSNKSLATTDSQSGLVQTTNLVKAGDKAVTLLGTQVYVGESAPNFRVVDKNFTPVQLSDFSSKTLLISVVPSLDTGVCSLQTKRFNEEVSNLPSDVIIITISNDLPFAQKRFCKIEKVDQIKVFSDSVWRDFGRKYGLLIKDMGLLTRAIFIVDTQGNIAYKELVANISNHPNYDQAFSALQTVINKVNSAADSSTENEKEQKSSSTNKKMKIKI